MLSNRLAYSGFSLVEMMISMVLGSTLFLLVSDAYVKSTVSIAKLQQIKHLDAQLNDITSLMSKEIKRAGFVNYNVDVAERYISQYRFSMALNGNNYKSPFYISDDGQCVVFFYDTNKNGCVGDINNSQCVLNLPSNVDFVGYKFDRGQLKYSPSNTSGCGAGYWSSMIDPTLIKIEKFSATITGVNPVLSADQTTKLNFPVVSIYVKASSVKDKNIKRDVTKLITLESPML